MSDSHAETATSIARARAALRKAEELLNHEAAAKP